MLQSTLEHLLSGQLCCCVPVSASTGNIFHFSKYSNEGNVPFTLFQSTDRLGDCKWFGQTERIAFGVLALSPSLSPAALALGYQDPPDNINDSLRVNGS